MDYGQKLHQKFKDTSHLQGKTINRLHYSVERLADWSYKEALKLFPVETGTYTLRWSGGLGLLPRSPG